MNIILFENKSTLCRHEGASKLPIKLRTTLQKAQHKVGMPSICVDASDPIYKHITRILRLEVGAQIRMGVINESYGQGTIKDISTEHILIRYHQNRSSSAQPCDDQGTSAAAHAEMAPATAHLSLPLILALGYVRPICAKRILREASMQGVQEIWLFPTELGEKSYQEASIWQDENYRQHLIDGASQAGSIHVPILRRFDSLKAALDAGASMNSIVLDLPQEGQEQTQSFAQANREHTCVLFIGSERGWSQAERKLFSLSHLPCLDLGARILRTETACAVAVGIYSQLLRTASNETNKE